MVYTLRFFSSKCSLFHNSNVFFPCIIHILYTGCVKIKKKFRRQKVNIAVSLYQSLIVCVKLLCVRSAQSDVKSNKFFFYSFISMRIRSPMKYYFCD